MRRIRLISRRSFPIQLILFDSVEDIIPWSIPVLQVRTMERYLQRNSIHIIFLSRRLTLNTFR